MQRPQSTWLSSSALTAILLSAVIILRLIGFASPHLHRRASLLPHPQLQIRRLIGETPARTSEEVEQGCKQQHKQAIHSLVPFSPTQPRGSYSQLLLLPLSYHYRQSSFFPRKLPPPSATDDPFLR